MATSPLLAADDRTAARLIALDRPRRTHLVGIGGTGMKALAELLCDADWQLTGSDPLNLPESLRSRGVRISSQQDASAIADETELLIYSPAIRPDNIERRWATERDIPALSYPQVLAQLSRQSATVSIAGTHGKSTTSALTAHLLDSAGLSPTVIVGAESRNRARSGWLGTGEHLVLESCEYQRNFLQLQPSHLAVTSIEPDHFDSFPQLDDALGAYAEFASSLPTDGALVIPAHDKNVWSIVRQSPGHLITFGVDCPADWQATDCRAHSQGIAFDLRSRGKLLCRVNLRLHGRHNVTNALAAVALADAVGVSLRATIAGLESFLGIRRRFEVVHDCEQFTLIDDYAHHPTAVRETLRAARECDSERRIVCVFQPHQISRTETLFDDFAEALTHADLSLIPPVFTAREQQADAAREWSRRLADAVRLRGGDSDSVESLDHLASTVEDKTRAGDVIFTMGAGDLNRINHELIGRLLRDSDCR